MGYKDKYNKLVEAIKVLQETNPSDEGLQNWVNDNVPELKESEAERIRKWCISHFNGCISVIKENDEYKEFLSNKVITWLKKQGVQPRYNIGDVICDKLCTTLNKDAQPNIEIVDIKNGMYICDKGSFPVSQQDGYELVSKKIDMKPVDSVSNELREVSLEHARNEMMSTTFPNNMTFEFAYNFEEGANWHAAQKHTLSKENEEMLSLIIARLHSHPDVDLEEYSKEYDWLNSPKDRSTWKPSDEQMAALNNAILLNEDHYNGAVLSTLREQLMKLK